MAAKERFLKISFDRIYYTDDKFINISSSNLPSKTKFSEGRIIWWKIEIVSYSAEIGRITVKVLDYSAKETNAFTDQRLKKPVSEIEFIDLLWSELMSDLCVYKLNEFSSLCIDLKDEEVEHENEIEEFYDRKENEINGWFTKGYVSEMRDDECNYTESEKEITLLYKYHDAVFKDGHVEIKPKIDEYGPVTLRIENEEITDDYHLVRDYFPKILKTRKKFEVHLKYIAEIEKPKILSCTSEEIFLINQNLFTEIKEKQVNKIEKFDFGNDVIIEESQIIDKLPPEIKHQKNFRETDIFEILIRHTKVRNALQLQYLAGKMQYSDTKVSYTLKPFGFVFRIFQNSKNYFVWELRETHATYIWSFAEKYHTADCISEVEQQIKIIMNIGRNNYKKWYNENGKDFDFFSIKHPETDNKKYNFKLWKIEFDKIFIS